MFLKNKLSLFSQALTCPALRKVKWNSSVVFLGAVVLKSLWVICALAGHMSHV